MPAVKTLETVISEEYWGIMPIQSLPHPVSPFVALQYGAWDSEAQYQAAYPVQGAHIKPKKRAAQMRFWGPLVLGAAVDGLTHAHGNALVRRALTAGLDDAELWQYSSGVKEARAAMAGANVSLGDGLDEFIVEEVPND